MTMPFFLLSLLLNKLALLLKSTGDVETCKVIRVNPWLFLYLPWCSYIYLIQVLDILTRVLQFLGRRKNFPLEQPKGRRTYHHITRVFIYWLGNGDRVICLYFFKRESLVLFSHLYLPVSLLLHIIVIPYMENWYWYHHIFELQGGSV